MTLFLASVRDEAEAEIALGAGADIIDLKSPAHGGAWRRGLQGRLRLLSVSSPGGRASSATIGDLADASQRRSATPVARSPVRVSTMSNSGSSPMAIRGPALTVLRRRDPQRSPHRRAIRRPIASFDAVAAAAEMGAAGIMLDTAGKKARVRFCDHVRLRRACSLRHERQGRKAWRLDLPDPSRRSGRAGAACPRARFARLSRHALPRLHRSSRSIRCGLRGSIRALIPQANHGLRLGPHIPSPRAPSCTARSRIGFSARDLVPSALKECIEWQRSDDGADTPRAPAGPRSRPTTASSCTTSCSMPRSASTPMRKASPSARASPSISR